MNEENENKLFKKHPKLFPNGRKVNPRESCMCFGFECGNGWFDLIDNLSTEIEKICEKNNVEPPQIVQVKEKFGGLRYYSGGINRKVSKEVFDLIIKAEELSFKICERCGSVNNVTQNSKGWRKSLCEKCRQQDEQSK